LSEVIIAHWIATSLTATRNDGAYAIVILSVHHTRRHLCGTAL